MKIKFITLAILPVLAACVEMVAAPPQQTKVPQKPTPSFHIVRSTQSGMAAFSRVSKRVVPVAKRSCRQIHRDAPPKYCDFVIKVQNDPKQPANAFQSVGRDGRPNITFNINMIRSTENDNEIAFILGHEAGHQIAGHLSKTRQNQTAGAILGGILAAAIGADVQSGVDLGGTVGARSYSKGYELQADRIGTYIADRAGYNPVIGARAFNRTTGSNALLATHPPSQDRIEIVNRTYAQIRAAKAQGIRTPQITW